MHERIIEARKRLAIAKDHYVAAVRAIEGAYVKPLVGAGLEAEDVAALRANYSVINSESAEDAAEDALDEAPEAPPAKPKKAAKAKPAKKGK